MKWGKHKREELAWAAGFFDGEGTTGAYSCPSRTTDGCSIRMAVSQVKKEPLERFHHAILGIGTIWCRAERSKTNQKPEFIWRVQTWKDCQAVIGLLWTFLSEVKREQIMKALEKYKNSPS